MEFETRTLISFVIMILFLTIVLGNAKQYGAFDQQIVSNPTTDYDLDYNITNISYLVDSNQFKPPTCSNVGKIPILSDMGCLALIMIWLLGFQGMTTDLIWFNYIWIIPLSIVVAILVARYFRGN